MADVNVSVTTLTEGTASGDLVGGGDTVTAGQTFAIAVENVTDDLIILMEEQNTGAAVVTIDAGVNPPAHRQGLGARTVDLAQADLKAIAVEGARHIQSDGTVTGSIATNDCKIAALRIPRTV